jgi:DNA (cytosine-5)-methyltransferase 1
MSGPKIGSLFTGYGGLDMAAELHYDARTVWTSDIDPAACKIIAGRMPQAPNLGNVTDVDWSHVEPVDILTGGFPCQDLSHAGRRAGLRPGTRSGLWTHMAYAISQLRPRYVVAENVRGLLSASAAASDLEPCPWCVGGPADGKPVLRALGAVLGDLAELGYDTRWYGLRASDVGAPHQRFRVFVVAADAQRIVAAGRGGVRDLGSTAPDSAGEGLQRQRDWDAADDRGAIAWGDYEPAIRRWEQAIGRAAPPPTETGPKGGQRLSPRFVEWMMGLPAGWVTDVPGLTRNAQLKALGNGVVPQQALAALQVLDALEAAA